MVALFVLIKKRLSGWVIPFCSIGIVLSLLPVASAHAVEDSVIAIRGGTVLTMAGETIREGTVLIRNSKIAAVGKNIRIPDGAVIVDAAGKYVMPGIVDAMTYYGLRPFKLNADDPVTPQVKVIQAFYPYGKYWHGKGGVEPDTELMQYGITALYIAPGNRQVIGGQGAIVKTFGKNLDDLTLRASAAIDMALGDPPKKPVSENKAPTTRMAVATLIRKNLIQAQEFRAENRRRPKPKRDPALEPLVNMLDKKIPARIEADFVDDIRVALKLAEEFGFHLILDSGVGAYQMKDILAAKNIPVVLGPPSYPYPVDYNVKWLNDLIALTNDYNAKELIEAGVKVAIASFATGEQGIDSGYRGRWLILEAGYVTGFGVSEEDALKAITINPAEILGIADRVGSLEKGKDADVIICDGPPLKLKTWVEHVFIDGKLIYSRDPN